MQDTNAEYEKYCEPGTKIAKKIGNMYTSSIFGGLQSLICEFGNQLKGKKIAAFSYGSGSAASIYTLHLGMLIYKIEYYFIF